MTEAAVARRNLPRWRYDYVPNEAQGPAHSVFADEVLFGGAAGPGKTDWLIAEHVAHAVEVPGSAGVIFRRTFPDLSRPRGIIQRLLERIPRHVATYNAGDHKWTFRNGSILELAHLEKDTDLQKYQGPEYTLASFDQLEQFTEYQYRYLGSRLRASGKVKRRLAELGLRPRRLATANPGGVGHAWVKTRFIDPAPAGVVWQPDATEDEKEPGTRVFIPGRLEQNPHVDESYESRLMALPEDERRALRYGDWDVFTGQRFKDFRRDIHVIEPEDYPEAWKGGGTRVVGLDYGLDAPFGALWALKGPDGLVVFYRELYEAGLTPTEQAEAVLAAEFPGERREGRPVPVATDPSTWARQPGQPAPHTGKGPPPGSIAHDYSSAGLPVVRANNDRLRGVALWANGLRVRKDERPRILIVSTCRNLIRTLPALIRDPRRPEDVDTKGEDHLYDAGRYALAELEGRPATEAEARHGTRSALPKTASGRPPVEDPGPGRSITGELRSRGF